MLKYCAFTGAPPVFNIVARVPALLEFNVSRLLAVPFKLKLATVVVVLAGKVTVAG